MFSCLSSIANHHGQLWATCRGRAFGMAHSVRVAMKDVLVMWCCVISKEWWDLYEKQCGLATLAPLLARFLENSFIQKDGSLSFSYWAFFLKETPMWISGSWSVKILRMTFCTSYAVKGSTCVPLIPQFLTFRKLGKATGGLSENHVALGAVDDGIGMGEQWADGLAPVALDLHIERIGALNNPL